MAADRLFFSGKHRCHGVNLQAITDQQGNLLQISGALRGAVHDTAAARIWQVPRHLAAAGLTALADKAYAGLAPDIIITPYKARKNPSAKSIQPRPRHPHPQPPHKMK